MGSINEQITRIEDAKTDINAAIIASGGPEPLTPEATIETYAARISKIPEAVFSKFTTDKIGNDNTYIKWVKQENGTITADTGGLVKAGSPGLLPPPTTPKEERINTTDFIFAAKIQEDNTLQVDWYQPFIHSVMTGANADTAGTIGLVPQPAAGQQTKFLRGDGTWVTPTNTDTKVTQTDSTGNSDYRVLLSYGANDTKQTQTTYKSAKLVFKPSTGTLTVNGSIIGKIDSSNINSLSNYSLGTAISAITQDDTLNSALGKLEYKANLGVSAKTWIDSITQTDDADAVINKWQEILTFINGIPEDQNILSKFVTTDTNQTITGSKTFSNHLIINHIKDGAFIAYQNQRQVESDAGWADSIINYLDSYGNVKSWFGVKGTSKDLEYIFLGQYGYSSKLNLRIYNNSISFGNLTQYETFQHINTSGAGGDNFNQNFLQPYSNKALIIGPNTDRSVSLLINRSGIQTWNTTSDTPTETMPSLYLQGAGGNTVIGGNLYPLNNNTQALGQSTNRWKSLNGYNIGCDNNNVFISAKFPAHNSSDITSIDSTVTSSTMEKYFKALCKYVFAQYKNSAAANNAITLIGQARPGSTGTLIMSLYPAANSYWTSDTAMPRYCSAVYTSVEGYQYYFGSTNDGKWYYRRTVPGYLVAQNITNQSHALIYYSGSNSVGTSAGNAKEGSNTYEFFSYPTGATAISNGTANIMSIRMQWTTSWLHEIFASPNRRQLWHRWIENGTPKPWSRIVLENNESESLKYNISISGNADTATKATKLDIVQNVGSSSRPVFFSALTGKPVACTWGTISETDANPYYITGFSNTTQDTKYTTKIYLKSNALYASKGFYEQSDERLKNLLNDVEVDLNKLKQIPKKYFTWKTDGSSLHIGTSAQEIQKLYPELVSTSDDGTLSVAYDKLSIIALKGIDILYDLVLDLKSEIKELKCKLNGYGV